MATTTRPFNITAPAPTTAREAQALATVLAEQESALARAQRLASDAARFTTAEQILAVDAVQAAEDRDQAVRAWESAAADPAASLEELLGAFIAMRSTSARRAAIVAQASGVMGQVKPLRNEHSGAPDEYRHDTADSLLRVEFGDAIETFVRARVDASAQVARNAVQARCTDAGSAAVAKVK